MKEDIISQGKPARRILVVEENSDIRQFSTEVLMRSGYSVDAAADAAAAWHALNSDHYDLLITDRKIRDMSGADLLTKLRVARMALPVIMATTNLPKGTFTRFPWLKPAVTLPKPYTVEEFLGKVTEALHASEASHEQIAPPSNLPSQPSCPAQSTQ